MALNHYDLPPLRPFQQSALNLLKPANSHVLIVAPTGSGKSRLFVEAARGQRTLLFSPLKALSEQHRYLLGKSGFRTKEPDPEVLILSPEHLLFKANQDRITSFKPELIVMDECHTLWSWGLGFRPAFLKILDLFNNRPLLRSLWLTATLPPEALSFLKSELAKRNVHPKVQGDFAVPPHLEFRATEVAQSQKPKLLKMLCTYHLRQHPGLGLIYVSSRTSAKFLFESLVPEENCARFLYHGGLSRTERSKVEAQVRDHRASEAGVLICTSAFGMGMDIRSVSWCILYDPPPTLMDLAQIAGRTGRLELKENSLFTQRFPIRVLWCENDFRTLEWLISNTKDCKNRPKHRDFFAVLNFLRNRLECRTSALTQALCSQDIRELGGPQEKRSCGQCDVCNFYSKSENTIF